MRFPVFVLICQLFVSVALAQAQIPKPAQLKAVFAESVSNRERAGRTEPIEKTFTERINEQVLQEIEHAWRASGGGVGKAEIVVFLYRMANGFLMARTLGLTNEQKESTFDWDPAAIAILHTHPNVCDPKPSKADKQVADRLGVPIFTLTSRGMYVYDPSTRSIEVLQKGLDWLEASSWSIKLSASGTANSSH